MRFWHLGLFLFIFLVGCGSEEVKGPATMEDRTTLYFSVEDAYIGFDTTSGRFCFWNNEVRRVFCGDLEEYEWVVGARIEDAEPKR